MSRSLTPRSNPEPDVRLMAHESDLGTVSMCLSSSGELKKADLLSVLRQDGVQDDSAERIK